MRVKHRRQRRLILVAVGGPAVVYFVSELRDGHSFLSALGALALPVVGAAVVWLVHWEATTPDGLSRGTDRSDQ